MSKKQENNPSKNNNRSKMPPPQMSQRINLIGVFVLALGFSAFVAVAYLGYVKFIHPASETTVQDASATAQKNSGLYKKQGDFRKLDLRKATLRDIVGSWRAKYGVNTATMTLSDDDQYEIVIYKDAIGYERLYSKGTFRHNNKKGTIHTKPSYEPAPEIPDTDIDILTNREYDVVVLRNSANGDVLWLPYEPEGRRAKPHPIFSVMGLPDGYIEWKADR
jgi:hypothetical protein